MRRGKLSYSLRFGKEVTKMRSITINEKHGKFCDNMKTEPKIFHTRINLVSDKLGKAIKITSLHSPHVQKRKLDYTQNKQKIMHENEKHLAKFRLLRSKIIMKFRRSGNITR